MIPVRAARTRRCCVAIVAAIGIAVAVSGCGTHRVDPDAVASTLDTDIPPTPSANSYVSAVLNSKTRGSAKLQTTITIETPEGQREITGAGAAFLEPGYGVMTWSADGSSFVEMVNDDGIFVQSSAPDGRWTQVVPKPSSKDAAPGTTSTSGSDAPLRGLGIAQDVVDQGPEKLGTVVADRYSGRLPLTLTEVKALGLSDDEIAAIGDTWQGIDEHVDVWVGPDGYISRVDRAVDFPDAAGGPISVYTTTTISKFGTVLDVTTPTSTLIDSPTASS